MKIYKVIEAELYNRLFEKYCNEPPPQPSVPEAQLPIDPLARWATGALAQCASDPVDHCSGGSMVKPVETLSQTEESMQCTCKDQVGGGIFEQTIEEIKRQQRMGKRKRK